MNKITAETPGAPIATLRITVDKINPVFLAKFPKSTVNRYDKSKIKLDKIINLIQSQNIEIIDIISDDGSLEGVFFKLTNE